MRGFDMNVIGYTESGMIRAILDGDDAESTIPDDMGNRHRFMIWDEWEMGPPDPETGERARINTIPAYVPPPPPPPAPYTLQMSDFWSRFENDDEYEAFDAAVSVAPLAKDRRAFGVAVFLVSNSPLFAWTKAILINVVAAERADVIMAPSTAVRSEADAA